MNNLSYFFEVSGCVCLLYVLYQVAFKFTTFFRANRIYLVAGLILSFVIPWLNLSFVPVDYHVLPTPIISQSFLAQNSSYPAGTSDVIARTEYSFIPFLYWSGVVLMISRLFYSVGSILRLKRRSKTLEYGDEKVYITDSAQPFSFFKAIFLPKGDINSMIYDHERAHVQNLHWIDLLVVEIASAFLWFNPLMILYRRSLKTQHEYEADASAIRNSRSIDAYLHCILNHLQGRQSSPTTSQFFDTNIKQRIIMMTTDKTPIKFSLLYLLFVPLVCLLLLAFSDRTTGIGLLNDVSDGLVIVVDAGHGGNDQGVSAVGGLTEKELTLSIARRIQQAGEARNVKVILTRTDDQALSLADRIQISNRHNADLFISIHANFNAQNTAASGIEAVISEQNAKFEESKAWSDKLVKELTGLSGVNVNSVMTADFYVLSKNSIPAVLLELGYLSNKTDIAYLADQKNQELISQRIISAITGSTK
ncbi:MAG TPA: M56/M15 family metallopeptidase [Chryseolinea sp.]|nr:M56/M15 family metallopeptidase [Chryseolinea sp.]